MSVGSAPCAGETPLSCVTCSGAGLDCVAGRSSGAVERTRAGSARLLETVCEVVQARFEAWEGGLQQRLHEERRAEERLREWAARRVEERLGCLEQAQGRFEGRLSEIAGTCKGLMDHQQQAARELRPPELPVAELDRRDRLLEERLAGCVGELVTSVAQLQLRLGEGLEERQQEALECAALLQETGRSVEALSERVELLEASAECVREALAQPPDLGPLGGAEPRLAGLEARLEALAADGLELRARLRQQEEARSFRSPGASPDRLWPGSPAPEPARSEDRGAGRPELAELRTELAELLQEAAVKPLEDFRQETEEALGCVREELLAVMEQLRKYAEVSRKNFQKLRQEMSAKA